MFTQIKPHPLEIIPDCEAVFIERVIEMYLEMMKSQDLQKRGQDPQQHVLLRGTFEISDSVPDKMRVGVFAEPKTFSALIHLTSGQNTKKSYPHPHSFAIKLLDIPRSPTGTQDFIFGNQPTFPFSDIQDYLALFEAQLNISSPSCYKAHLHDMGVNLKLNFMIANYLGRQFWSSIPVAMGNRAARFTLIPGEENLCDLTPTPTPEGNHQALKDYFVNQRRSAKFLFGAQSYIDEVTTPIEYAKSAWPTPFETIATLTLPAQDFEAPKQFEFCKYLTYTPWHCVPEHQPLGGIQRCQKIMYEKCSQLRFGLTGTHDSEPTKADFDNLGAFL